MGCCQPVLAPVENYYTKYQVDQMLEEIESAITSGCCITPEEVDEKIEEAISGISPDLSDYYTKEEVDELIPEVPSLSGYATKQWVEDKHYITGVDLSDYVTYESLPDLSVYATKTWVINQNYITNSEVIQYITNLQQQIDSLKEQISGCCGSTGETLTRWITMTGVNNYTCSGTTKMTKEKEQTSSDGGNTWTDTGNYRAGSTVLEVNSADCGYVPPAPTEFKYKLTLDDSSVVYAECDSTSAITRDEVSSYISTLVDLEVGDCVTEISNCDCSPCGAFSYFRNLSSVTLSDSVTTIGENVFRNCTSLGSINIPDSVTSIGSYAFQDCSGLTSVTIGSGLTSMGSETFVNTGLRSITIPDTITDLGSVSLAGNFHLTSVTLSQNVTSIGFGVFGDCPSLTSVGLEGSGASIEVPSGVTSIGARVFENCSGLTSVTLSENITSIGTYAFENCTSLQSITINATVPPTITKWNDTHKPFENTNNCPIYVPAQSVEIYKTATYWTQYASRIQAIS